MPRLLLLCALLGLAAPAALAQPDPTAAPVAGTFSLRAGFAPDPHAVDVTVSGAETADCPGFYSVAPTVVLDYGGGGALRLFARSSYDTTLLVQAPGGDWRCEDDTEMLSPSVLFDGASAGRYAIWIGTYAGEEGGGAPVTLYVSGSEVGTALDPAGVPTAGTVALGAGFSPDPHEVPVTAGGLVPASYDEGCSGFYSAAPSAVLDYGGSGDGPLYVYARAASDDDLTLRVAGPDGAVYCNDDAVDFNPGLVVEPAAAGRYAVWVGTYGSRARTESQPGATLFFSGTEGPTASEEYYEDDYYEEDGGSYEGGEDISRFAAPAHGTLTLDPGFGEREAAVEAGGTDAVSVSGFGCVGYIDRGEPDLNVLYGGDGETLSFYTDGTEDDLTMLVNLPDGSWRCSDDAVGRDPAIVVEAPEGGLYNVWVGTYAPGAGSSATLHVAERDPR